MTIGFLNNLGMCHVTALLLWLPKPLRAAEHEAMSTFPRSGHHTKVCTVPL